MREREWSQRGKLEFDMGDEGRGEWGKPAPEKQMGKAETRVMLTMRLRVVTELVSKLEISPLNAAAPINCEWSE